MLENRVAENVLGTMGTICWTGQVLPQVWKSWRTKDTEGLSHWLMLLWAIAAVFLGVFAITQNFNIPLIVQPQLFSFLSYLSWTQCMYYGYKKPFRTTLALFCGGVLILGGFEAGMIFAIRPSVRRGNQAPVTFFGVATSVLLAAGLLPQYYEIWKYGEVKGISLLFMTIDLLGGVFSVLSLVFKERFDVLGGVAYGAVVVLDAVVLIAALILNPRAERRRSRALAQFENGTDSVYETRQHSREELGNQSGGAVGRTSADFGQEDGILQSSRNIDSLLNRHPQSEHQQSLSEKNGLSSKEDS